MSASHIYNSIYKYITQYKLYKTHPNIILYIYYIKIIIDICICYNTSRRDKLIDKHDPRGHKVPKGGVLINQPYPS